MPFCAGSKNALPPVSNNKRLCCVRKERSIYQDRLGTNLEKERERRRFSQGMPDPAADLGAPVDLRYPAVYITRRGHEDIDEVVDPEFL